MAVLTEVTALQHRGRFAEALAILEATNAARVDRVEYEVLQAELFERVGRYADARSLCDRLLRRQEASGEQKARCECTLGLLNTDEGHTEKAQTHFQRAVALARAAKNLRLSCVAQLRLILLLADKSGHQSIAPLVPQARADVTKLGDPCISATLHIFMGAIETRRGLLSNGVRHTDLGLRMLAAEENLWLQALADNTLVAASLMTSDIAGGIDIARRALDNAQRSGAAAMRRAALANLGNLYYQLGDFLSAVRYFEKARAVLHTCGDRDNATLDSIALAFLAQGRLRDARIALDTIDAAVANKSDWLLYGNRYSRLTRTLLLIREGRLETALAQIDDVLNLAATVGDSFLRDVSRMVKADIVLRTQRLAPFFDAMTEVVDSLPDAGPHLYAQYLQLLMRGYAHSGRIEEAERLFRQSGRMYEVLRSVPARNELHATWDDLRVTGTSADVQSRTLSNPSVECLLQNVAGLLLQAGRPELVASTLVAVLENAGTVVSATAVSRGTDGSSETIAACSSESETNPITRTFSIGSARGRAVEVDVQFRADIGSIATVNAITLLLGTIHDLERAEDERQERLTLWPLEEPTPSAEQAVVMGRLSVLMAEVRRVAGTSVNVLITGESGTGKEIVARAIHRYSARADRPFLPFNCAAVPREMLESQLFGHRRGAFTGADRDNPGVIRAAGHGTLLLDEIGELSLELQPKLLRFLESGEISPLGDPSPLTVDVRIVAATNANLDQLVQEGRFREDLFYRLNVIRLTIPPLRERRDEIPALVHHFVARAAQEFRKARIRVAEETMEHLIVYAWPGNVRQLNNEVRRMVALAESDSTLKPSALSKEILRATPLPGRGNLAAQLAVPLHDKLQEALSRVEREMIKAALKTSDGRVDAAARALGISRKGLYLKRQRLGL